MLCTVEETTHNALKHIRIFSDVHVLIKSLVQGISRCRLHILMNYSDGFVPPGSIQPGGS